jgi:hypothetical protein
MARPGWINENSNRAFPFLPSTVGTLPDDVIADFGCEMGYASGYEEGTHSVWLAAIRRTGDTFYFDFETSAPGCESDPLTFTRDLTDVNATEYLELYPSVSYSLDPNCPGAELWSGYLVTGKLDQLALLLADGDTLTLSCLVEPALVRSYVGHFVHSVSAANADRTRVTLTPGCPGEDLGSPSLWLEAVCITGAIRFEAGYNCVVDQNDETNTIAFSAAVGAGEGEPCAELPLAADEMPPPDRELLDGSLRCNDCVRTINGVGGRITQLLAGPGVTLLPDADNHTLNITISR